MGYIGRGPTKSGTFGIIDDIASSFNGSTTAFTLQNGGSNITPGTEQNLLISVDGVMQEPVDAYTISGSTITFTSAPASGASFWGVELGDVGGVPEYSITQAADDSSTKIATTAYVQTELSGISSSSSTISVTQSSHGLAVGDVVRPSGNNTYTKSLATTEANAEVIGVVTVVSGNDYTITISGEISTAAAVNDVAAGTVLFLSKDTAGELTATEPSATNEVSKPVAMVTQQNAKMILLPFRGELVSSSVQTNAPNDATYVTLSTNSTLTSERTLAAGSGITLADAGANGAATISIANDAIDSQHYAAGSIDNEHLANNAVDSDELAAGSVDIAHLSASGTKDGTTVLHGNNTFATVSAGISGHGTVVIKSSDQTVNNSTTLVNDDTLVWALAANKNYRLWAHAFIDTHIHSDFKWTFTGPSGCEIHLTVNRNYAAGASYDWHGLNSLGTVVSMGTPSDTASNWYWFGTIMNGGNAGNLQLQWAQNAAQSFDTKMHNGSWGIVELLN